MSGASGGGGAWPETRAKGDTNSEDGNSPASPALQDPFFDKIPKFRGGQARCRHKPGRKLSCHCSELCHGP